MMIEFVKGGPALLAGHDERLLIVADLHFGIESGLAAKGIHFSSRSRDRLDRLLAVIDEAKLDRLILLGDVKHSIPALTRQEFSELPEILETLRERAPILIFPGNHDAGIERFAKTGELQPSDGAVIDGIGFLHGHTNPSPDLAGSLLVVGHHHPLLAIKDEVGCALQAPAYIRAGLGTTALGWKGENADGWKARGLFVPAFNELAGYDLMRTVKDPFSPLSRAIMPCDAEVILADGTFMGPLHVFDTDDDS